MAKSTKKAPKKSAKKAPKKSAKKAPKKSAKKKSIVVISASDRNEARRELALHLKAHVNHSQGDDRNEDNRPHTPQERNELRRKLAANF